MRGKVFGCALVALPIPASAAAFAPSGVTPPVRLEHTIAVECGKLIGRVAIEEGFVRSPVPRSWVKLLGVTPLGTATPVRIDPSLPPLFDRMLRIDKLQWFCDGSKVTVSIRYVDREAWANHLAAREAGRDPPRPGNMKLYLDLTRTGLVADSPPRADVE